MGFGSCDARAAAARFATGPRPSLPGISLSGWAFGSLISGAVVVETIFARPGLGRTMLNAVTVRDVPVVIGVVMIVAVGYILMTVVTDLAQWIADPRLRRR